MIISVYILPPFLEISLICCLLCFPQSTQWKQLLTHWTLLFRTKQLFGVLQLLVRLWADDCILMEEDHCAWFGAPLHSLYLFNTNLHGCVPACRSYINSSLHLFCAQPFQITRRGIEITALFDRLHIHAALPIAMQCLQQAASWFPRYLDTCYLVL